MPGRAYLRYYLLFVFLVISITFLLLRDVHTRLPSLPEEFTYKHRRLFPSTGPTPVSACLNPTVYATTKFAFVGILSVNEEVSRDVANYVAGAQKLGLSLGRFTNLDLVLMVPVDPSLYAEVSSAWSHAWMDLLSSSGWQICFVPVIDEVKMDESRFYQAKLFSKLNAWRLVEYEAVAVLDSDMLCVSDPAPLFTHELPLMLKSNATLAAHRDHPGLDAPPLTLPMRLIGQCWKVTSKFNAGLLLIKPSEPEYRRLIEKMRLGDYEKSWCEQGLLNAEYGGSFHPLPYRYNANLVAKYCEPTLWERERDSVVLYHYTVAKPWSEFSLFNLWSCPWWNVEPECQLWRDFDLPRHPKVAHNVTVVTALYDINRPDRPFRNYLEWMKLTFKMNYPMVIFCRPSHVQLVRQARRGLLDITYIVLEEEFPYQNTSVRVGEILKAGRYKRTPEWTCPEYIPLNYAKFSWLARSIQLDPFSTDYFYWVDAGLGRFFPSNQMGSPRLGLFDLLEEDRVSVQLSTQESLPPRYAAVGSNDSPFLAGVFGGSKRRLLSLCYLATSFYFDELLAKGKLDNEQVALGVLYRRHAGMFKVLTAKDFPEGSCNIACI